MGRRGVCSLLVLFALVLSVSGCSDATTSARAPANSADRAALASVMVGSDAVLAPSDVTLVDVIGLDLVGLDQPLGQWWSTLQDPNVAEVDWLRDSPDLVRRMRSTVDHVATQTALASATTAVRDTFTPYVVAWRDLLAALDAGHAAIAAGDQARQAQATTAYNTALAGIARLDRQRVARVVAALGTAQARQLVTREGLDPASFGL